MLRGGGRGGGRCGKGAVVRKGGHLQEKGRTQGTGQAQDREYGTWQGMAHGRVGHMAGWGTWQGGAHGRVGHMAG